MTTMTTTSVTFREPLLPNPMLTMPPTLLLSAGVGAAAGAVINTVRPETLGKLVGTHNVAPIMRNLPGHPAGRALIGAAMGLVFGNFLAAAATGAAVFAVPTTETGVLGVAALGAGAVTTGVAALNRFRPVGIALAAATGAAIGSGATQVAIATGSSWRL